MISGVILSGRALRAADDAFALCPLARQLAGAPDGFSLFPRLALGGLLEMVATLHFTEETFTLHLLLQRAKGLLDIVVADDDLNDGALSIGRWAEV